MKKRILVVEDEEKLRRVIELQLVSGGFDVDKAATAEEALKVVDRADLVLTDLKLPSMDGLSFLAVIRRQNAHVSMALASETSVHARITPRAPAFWNCVRSLTAPRAGRTSDGKCASGG